MKRHLKSLKAGLTARSPKRTENLRCKAIIHDSDRFGDYKPMADLLKSQVANGQLSEVAAELEKQRALGLRDELGEYLHIAMSRILTPNLDSDEVSEAEALRLLKSRSDWFEANPNNPIAVAVLAETLQGMAWHYRGSEYAHKVKSKAWEHYQSLTGQAGQLFRKTSNLSQHWSWAMALARFGLVDCENADDVVARYNFARQFAALSPDLIGITAYALLPRWYGDYKILEQFAAECGAHTHAQIGEGGYMAAYLTALENHEEAADLHMDRARFRQGLLDWLRVFPSQYKRTKMISICFNAHLYDEALELIGGLTELHFEVFETGGDLFMVNSVCQEFSSAK